MNYYNEHDPKCAQWLRNLIDAGELPAGDVDTRDIQTISPHELTSYTQQHFFAGIGGWSLALKLAGWPADRPVRTGSCPCQPFSAAGKGLAEADQRHLWPVFRDLIAFGEPTVTFGEQVASAAGRVWLARVRADLEGMGYGVGAADLCSAGVGSPNIRQRLYWMAYASTKRHSLRNKFAGVTSGRTGSRAEALRCGELVGLADSDGGNSSEEWQQRGGQHGQLAQDGGSCGLEHATSDGRQQRGTKSGRGSVVGGCSVGGMADTSSARSASWVSEPPQRKEGNADQFIDGSRGSGFWSAFDFLPCTDGKARRIEPGSFPLAHGIPGRVGLLRGYGNAINPYLAAEFIQASVEVLSLR